jgi:hypothetical protein
MTCAQVLPTRFALGSHTKTADKVCNRLEQRWVATAIVTRIDELFAIDAEARRQALSLEARHALPRQQSRPLLDEIRKQVEGARSTALPGGALAKAYNYVLTLRDIVALTRQAETALRGTKL